MNLPNTLFKRNQSETTATTDEPKTHWHALTTEETLQQLHTHPEGLSDTEAANRQIKYGPNALPETNQRSLLEKIVSQFRNVLIYVLLIAALITTLLGHSMDALVILSVVLINAVIGLIQEGKAEKALDSIRHMVDPEATVVRHGHRQHIDATQIVPGDVVFIQAGDRVPADLRLIQTSNLQIDDALLTGESMVVTKETSANPTNAALGDRRSMAFWGTFVSTGQGLGVVVETGSDTELGKISTLINQVETLKTPLVRQMDQFAEQLTWFILAVSAVAFGFATVIQDYALTDAFLAVVGLAVAAIPEGLPAIMTITLAIGVQQMASKNAIIRRLPAVETLGSVTVICSDKTGTLTCNEMMVQNIVTQDHHYTVTGSGYTPKGSIQMDGQTVDVANHHTLSSLLKAGILNNDAELREDENRWVVEGNPMEAALLSVAMKANLDPMHLRQLEPRVDDIPFDSAHKFMATRHEIADSAVTFVKGAPERIVGMCEQVQTANGIESIDRSFWEGELEKLAAQGNRIIAIAVFEGPAISESLGMDDIQSGGTLLGFIGLVDPPRPEAITAITDSHTAGIRVIMITGDHALTAKEIARQLGISEDPVVCTGDRVEAANDQELRRLVHEVDVFARTTPEHKLRIVTALQAEGHIATMTGDGVNDAPALKRAEVGIAMGKKGTEAAKEAAEMVLADDNFATIIQAIKEGRTVFDNIIKVIAWTLPTNGAQAMTIITALVLGMTLPITPIQILWVNMVSAVALGLTLAFEPHEKNVLSRPPRPSQSPILSRRLIWQVAFVSTLFVTGTFGLFLWALDQGASIEVARTLGVNTLIALEIVYLFSIRYAHNSSLTLEGMKGTPAVWIGIISITLLQAAFTWIGPMQSIFGTASLSSDQLLVMTGVAIVTFLILEIEKLVGYKLNQKRYERLDPKQKLFTIRDQ